MLNEKKTRLSLTGAIIILSICLVFSAFTISSAIRDLSRNSVDNETYKYELERYNENFEELIKILKENDGVDE